MIISAFTGTLPVGRFIFRIFCVLCATYIHSFDTSGRSNRLRQVNPSCNFFLTNEIRYSHVVNDDTAVPADRNNMDTCFNPLG